MTNTEIQNFINSNIDTLKAIVSFTRRNGGELEYSDYGCNFGGGCAPGINWNGQYIMCLNDEREALECMNEAEAEALKQKLGCVEIDEYGEWLDANGNELSPASVILFDPEDGDVCLDTEIMSYDEAEELFMAIKRTLADLESDVEDEMEREEEEDELMDSFTEFKDQYKTIDQYETWTEFKENNDIPLKTTFAKMLERFKNWSLKNELKILNEEFA